MTQLSSGHRNEPSDPARYCGVDEQIHIGHQKRQRADQVQGLVDAVVAKHPGATANVEVTEQYRNMKEVVDLDPRISSLAVKAIEMAGIPVQLTSARGGTDGSRLSFMGLPCPNLFTGEMAFHGKHEYVSVQDMQKSSEVLVNLAGLWV